MTKIYIRIESYLGRCTNRMNRNTWQKEIVYETTRNLDHPTADAVYHAASERFSSLSRGTVYRNLNLMVENGIIQRVQNPFGADHFDYNLAPHYHFICKQCCGVFDINAPIKSQLEDVKGKNRDFEIELEEVVY